MRSLFGVCIALLALTPTTAHAGKFDFQLAGFGSLENGVQMDVDGFQNFAGDLAMALHPKFAGPANSLGGLGIDFGYQIGLTDIDTSAEHWRKPLDSPDGPLTTSHFYVRKGLPYSFELGGFLSHVHDSDLWAVGLELKWAFIEGHESVPEFGLRAHVNTLLGNRDMVMVTSGGEFIISKAFGIAGLMQVAPYAGYELTYIHARSHVLGIFPEGGLEPETFILPTQDFVRHRGLIGLLVVAGIMDFGFEAALGEVQSYTFKVGFNL